jgi:ribose transport system permease protein
VSADHNAVAGVMSRTAGARLRLTLHRYRVETAMFVVLVLLVVYLGASTGKSLTSSNLRNVLQQAAPLLLIGFGQLAVMITGGIDLSVGATFGLSGMVTVVLMSHLPTVVACLIGLGVGLGVGLINGALVVYGRFVPFIVTLATFSIAGSIAYVVSGGNSHTVQSTGFTQLDQGTLVPGVPNYLLYMIVAAVLAHLLLTYTVGGRSLYATGSSENAARIGGIRVDRAKLLAYAMAGLLSAAAAVLTASELLSVDPTSGGTYQLNSIAAVVIGGGSLFGGIGTAAGTVIGVLIVSFLGNALVLLQVPSFWQGTVTGAVIIVAVAIERLTNGGLATKLRVLFTKPRRSTGA